MKKILALFLALSMLFVLAACGSSEAADSTPSTTKPTEATGTPTTNPTETPTTNPTGTGDHTHSYNSEVTQAVTCTEKGVKTFSCTCGSTYTESIAAVGHAWGEWTTFEPATTTEKGESRRNCKNCTEFESKEIPVKPIQEHNVDTSINLTGTAYEAAVRQYTNDYNYTQYYEGEFSNRFVFEMNDSNCGNTNVLSLTDLRAYIYVKRNPGQLGTLYMSEHHGYISCTNISGTDAIRQVLTNASAAFGPQNGSINVDGYGDGWFSYSSVSEIPEETLQKIVDGKACLDINYGTSHSFSFGLSCDNNRLYIRYHIYYSEQDGI